MIQLNLPNFDIKLRKAEGRIEAFDIIRKKFVVLTPEEWVRQNFIHFLISNYKYPKSLIKIESGLKYNKLGKRSDILVYDRAGLPFLLVECKAPEVKISQKTFEQAGLYNFSLKARYMAVSNGLDHFCCRLDAENRNYHFLPDIPPFEDVV